jgi:hypothetical protein
MNKNAKSDALETGFKPGLQMLHNNEPDVALLSGVKRTGEDDTDVIYDLRFTVYDLRFTIYEED